MIKTLSKVGIEGTYLKIMKIICHDQVGLILGMQGLYNICKSVYVLYPINKMKDKNHMIISIHAEKAFYKVQHPFMIKTLSNVGIEGTYFNIMKAMYGKPTTNIIFLGGINETFPSGQGDREVHFHCFYSA